MQKYSLNTIRTVNGVLKKMVLLKEKTTTNCRFACSKHISSPHNRFHMSFPVILFPHSLLSHVGVGFVSEEDEQEKEGFLDARDASGT